MRIKNNVAIFLWLYHTDLAIEFYDLLKNLSGISIYLGLCKDNDNVSVESLFQTLPNLVNIEHYDNEGADILSFLRQLQNISDQDHKYFIKIHSKKSEWGYNNRCNWRAMLLDSLLGDQSILNNNISYIQDNNDGSLGCGSLIYHKNESVHKNQIRHISNICKLRPDCKNKFVGGNMFMGDTTLYQSVLLPELETISDLLGNEKGKVNEIAQGTYCHAMERIFGYIGCYKGLENCQIPTITLKIFDTKLTDQNITELNFRIMYNAEIYCIEQPSMFGQVSQQHDKSLQILWQTDSGKILADYTKIDTDKYVNNLYINNGV
jgi:hypothetical protein